MRKRVIKLLKSFYSVTDETSRRIDIGTKLVLRMTDEDDTVKDLAVKTMEELWFQNITSLASAIKGKPPVPNSLNDKGPLLSKVAVIMGVSSNFKDRQSPLEDMLHKIIADKDGDVPHLRASYAEICEALIDGLVDASDLPGFVRSYQLLFFNVTLTSSSDRNQLCQNNTSFHLGLSSILVWSQCFHVITLSEECHHSMTIMPQKLLHCLYCCSRQKNKPHPTTCSRYLEHAYPTCPKRLPSLVKSSN